MSANATAKATGGGARRRARSTTRRAAAERATGMGAAGTAETALSYTTSTIWAHRRMMTLPLPPEPSEAEALVTMKRPSWSV